MPGHYSYLRKECPLPIVILSIAKNHFPCDSVSIEALCVSRSNEACPLILRYAQNDKAHVVREPHLLRMVQQTLRDVDYDA
jgi:hypothetical protein